LSRLPAVSGQEVVEALRKIGNRFDHQRCRPIILRQADPPHRRVTVPDHDEVAKGTSRAILRHAGLSVNEFIALL
jgi:predicted RNA binding protein YcfA (HicA-like mRNA interferase family)